MTHMHATIDCFIVKHMYMQTNSYPENSTEKGSTEEYNYSRCQQLRETSSYSQLRVSLDRASGIEHHTQSIEVQQSEKGCLFLVLSKTLLYN